MVGVSVDDQILFSLSALSTTYYLAVPVSFPR